MASASGPPPSNFDYATSAGSIVKTCSVRRSPTAALSILADGFAVFWGSELPLHSQKSVGKHWLSNVSDCIASTSILAFIMNGAYVGVNGSNSFYLKGQYTRLHTAGDSVVAFGFNGTLFCHGSDSCYGAPPRVHHVADIASTRRAFAVRTEEGTLITWGVGIYGANAPVVASVTGVWATSCAFLVRSGNDTLVWWGCGYSVQNMTLPEPLVDVCSTDTAWALVFGRGTVYVLSPQYLGFEVFDHVAQVFASSQAFAFKLRNSSVVCTGSTNYGGSCMHNDVSNIVAYDEGFCMRRDDNQAQCWGSSIRGSFLETVGVFSNSDGVVLSGEQRFRSVVTEIHQHDIPRSTILRNVDAGFFVAVPGRSANGIC